MAPINSAGSQSGGDAAEMSQSTLRALTLASAEASPRHEEDWKRGIAEVFFGRLRTIALVTLAVFAGALLICLFMPPLFEASSSILVRVKPAPMDPKTLQEGRSAAGEVSKEDLTTELQLLTSTDVLRRAVGVAEGVKPSEQQAAELQRIRSGLNGEVVPGSNVIAVRLKSRDKEWAERTLDRIVREYLTFRARAFHPTGQREFLRERVDDYRKRLESVESELARQLGASSVSLVDHEVRTNLALAHDFQRRLGELQLLLQTREQAAGPLQQALQSKVTQYFAFLASEALDRMSSKLLDLRTERLALLRLYPPGHEKVLAIDKSIASADAELRAEAAQILLARRAEIDSLKQQIAMVQDKLKTLTARNIALQDSATRIEQLKREAGILKTNYATFARRAEEATLNAAVGSSGFPDDVSVLSWARTSAALIFPRPVPTLGIGLVLGLLLGLALALLFEFLDHTVKRPEDVSRHLGLPVLFSIPAA